MKTLRTFVFLMVTMITLSWAIDHPELTLIALSISIGFQLGRR